MNAFKYIGVYSRVDEKFTVFSFPTDNDECDKCIQALPNTINNATKYTGVFEIDRGSRIVPKEKQEVVSIVNFEHVIAGWEVYFHFKDVMEYMKKQPPDSNAERISCSSFFLAVLF